MFTKKLKIYFFIDNSFGWERKGIGFDDRTQMPNIKEKNNDNALRKRKSKPKQVTVLFP